MLTYADDRRLVTIGGDEVGSDGREKHWNHEMQVAYSVCVAGATREELSGCALALLGTQIYLLARTTVQILTPDSTKTDAGVESGCALALLGT